ncbi:putative leader peptide [uncultured Jatrophihabitans sp.]
MSISLLVSAPVTTALTSRRAVDLCRVRSCLCRCS